MGLFNKEFPCNFFFLNSLIKYKGIPLNFELDSFYIEIPLLIFFLNSLKKYNEITFKFELGSFYIEIPLLIFFIRKSLVKIFGTKLVWSCSKFAQIHFRINNFAQFWNIRDFFWKVRKKSDFKFEILQNFKLEIGFFSDFAKKVANVPKFRKFIWPELHLSEFWAKSETLFFRKKRPP